MAGRHRVRFRDRDATSLGAAARSAGKALKLGLGARRSYTACFHFLIRDGVADEAIPVLEALEDIEPAVEVPIAAYHALKKLRPDPEASIENIEDSTASQDE